MEAFTKYVDAVKSDIPQEAKVKCDAYLEEIKKLESGEHVPQISEDEHRIWLHKWQVLEGMLSDFLTVPQSVADKLISEVMSSSEQSPMAMLKGTILGVAKAKAMYSSS